MVLSMKYPNNELQIPAGADSSKEQKTVLLDEVYLTSLTIASVSDASNYKAKQLVIK
jgi:hypothetical protein